MVKDNNVEVEEMYVLTKSIFHLQLPSNVNNIKFGIAFAIG